MDSFEQKTMEKAVSRSIIHMKEGVKREVESESEGDSSSAPSTPCKHKSSLPTTPASRSSTGSKSSKKGSDMGTPSRAGGTSMKWAGWEDTLICDAILMVGEKGISWHEVTDQINKKRGQEVSRSVGGVRIHWTGTLKPRLKHLYSGV
jgi:hypothetical protein